jgi:carbohydrate diacid regulator
MMQLSAQNAQRIVNEIGTIVKQNINMMDAKGNIIASTDPLRVGTFHRGAQKVVDERLPELYITPDMETTTTRAGLNLPIVLGQEIVGVIGITGEYGQVVNYGQIVKKMTEILMRESTEQDQKRFDQRIRSRFLEEWVLGEGLANGEALAERGLALGIDIALRRRVMVVSVQNLTHYTDTAKGQELMEKLEADVGSIVEADSASNIILRNAGRQIILATHRSDVKMHALARRISEEIKKNFDVALCIGIDSTSGDVHQAYAQANKAWRSSSSAPDGILAYDRVTMEIFLTDISKNLKEEYLHKIFPGCGWEDLRRWVGILEVYFSAEGSITHAAEQLYIHKNTLQYQLKKLEELTGYDVRLPSNAPVLYMAVLFFKDVEGDLMLLDK